MNGSLANQFEKIACKKKRKKSKDWRWDRKNKARQEKPDKR